MRRNKLSERRPTQLTHPDSKIPTSLAMRVRRVLDQNANFLYFLLILPAPFAAWLLQGDFFSYLIWWLALVLCGLLVWPLSARVFGTRYAYVAAKPLGLLLFAFLSWQLSYIQIAPFRAPVIWILAALVGLAIWFLCGRKNLAFLPQTGSRPVLRLVGHELLFAFALLFWSFARGLKPELEGLEKFMDVGFMNSLWRTDWLPAEDLWYAGAPINYYYFGHYIFAFLAKATGIHPSTSYNLSLATTFAMTASLSYAIGSALMSCLNRSRRALRELPNESSLPAVRSEQSDTRSKPEAATSAQTMTEQLLLRQDRSQNRLAALQKFGAGCVSLLLVTILGNGHAFYYADSGPGRYLTRWILDHRFAAGDLSPYWFADATRFIGYNPDIADKTIHEFPWYSFLVADLHAHLINLMFVLLFLLLLIRRFMLAARSEEAEPAQSIQEQSVFRNGSKTHPVTRCGSIRCAAVQLLPIHFTQWLSGIFLAAFMMGNYWDFVIYFAVFALCVVLLPSAAPRKKTQLISWFWLLILALFLLLPFLLIKSPWLSLAAYLLVCMAAFAVAVFSPDGLTQAGFELAWIFFLAHAIALPFNLNFEPIAKAIRLTANQTSAWQLFVLWSPHVFAGALTIIWILRYSLKSRVSPQTGSRSKTTAPKLNRIQWRVLPADRLALILFVCAIGLLVLPELVYVVDIYGASYARANTMFKFTYQAFVLLGIVWGYGMFRLWTLSHRALPADAAAALSIKPDDRLSVRLARPAAILLAVMLIIPAWYPILAARQWLGPFDRSRYIGLNGTDVLRDRTIETPSGEPYGSFAADIAVANWLNEHVQGQPVLLEAYGSSYSLFGRISALTGLPTVLGWETHEWLWRTSQAHPDAYQTIVIPRQNDVRALYTTQDEALRRQLMKQYRIAYIVVGSLERMQFSANPSQPAETSLIQEEALSALGTVVFASDDGRTYLIAVEPAS